ncbi:hypothetical protein HKCCE3408_08580 [Rhodobacterales bacterium HKCCE3408]|nr:hypothetical protein [Rhodobacterales bacterium HKCCE3408]
MTDDPAIALGSTPRHTHLASSGASARFDPVCGILRDIEFRDDGRVLTPMHRAPWGAAEVPADAPPHFVGLEGDFFCAPFGDGGGNAPIPHGWTANGTWHVVEGTASELRAELEEDVQGARVETRLSVRDGHPFLYQSHILRGGSGRISAANHAMVRLPGGGLLSFSPKAQFQTPPTPLEPDPTRGRFCLRYPAVSSDPTDFPAADAKSIDLTRYPFGGAHEDFVIGIEAPDTALGWTAVVRIGQGDAFLSLRNAGHLPMTMLWHSNGGRDYAPWSGRHRACLGIEEGWAPHMLAEDGGFALTADGMLDIRHAIGAIAWPTEERIVSVATTDDGLRVEGEAGAVRHVPFDTGHLFPDTGRSAP